VSDQTTVISRKPSKEKTPRSKVPCLIVLEGNNIGETYQLTKKSIVIGRGDGADLVLVDDGISRHHARIDLHEDKYTLTDLDSTNGSFVNDDRVAQAALHDGDKIQLGDMILKFSFQDTVDVDYQEKLRNMAMRDALTKLFNRRYFTNALAREVSFALRRREPLACIMFDIDRFKSLNDTYGHNGGDAVLRGIGEKLGNEVRGYDLVARYGGEEFVILLRATALDNALILADRLRKMMEAMEFDFEGKKLKITVSVGVSALDPDRAVTAEDLIKQADRYLYEAKEQGRNRVCSIRTIR
jgi:two-component system, cell cycle response regulator